MWEWSLEFSLLLWLYAEGLTIFTLFGLVFILFGGLLITVFRVVLNFAGLMNHVLAVGFLWFWCSFLVFVFTSAGSGQNRWLIPSLLATLMNLHRCVDLLAHSLATAFLVWFFIILVRLSLVYRYFFAILGFTFWWICLIIFIQRART